MSRPASALAPDRAARPLARVAIVTPAWPGGETPNGIVTYSASFVPALRSKGIEVFVVAGVDGSTARDPHVSVPVAVQAALPLRALGRVRDVFSPGAGAERHHALTIVREIQRLEREHAIDLVEMEESFGWCGWLAQHCRVPVVARLHGPWFLNGAMVADPTTRPFRRRVRREGEAIARVAGVSAPSRDVLERTRAYYGQALANAEVIPNPLPPVAPVDHWDPRTCEPGTILFVGRFDAHKGGDTIVEAFARIRSQEPGARLLFVGPDPGVTDDAGRRWQLADFVRARLPRDADRAAVEWLGPQPAAAVRQLRKRAAVTVVCSRWEVFGYTLAEAMGQGCPIVATATGGLAEIARDGVDGLLVPPADPDALARATLELLRDRERAAAFGRQALEGVTKRLGPGAIADEAIAFYQRVLARASAR